MANNEIRPDILVLQIVAATKPGATITNVLQILRVLCSRHFFGLVTQSDSYILDGFRSLVIPSCGEDR
jgi:hypothetical protein